MSDGALEQLAEEAGSLTEIAREVLKRELARRKLSPGLREPDPANEPPVAELVTLRRYLYVQDAALAKTVLDSAEIESRLGDENTIRMDWLWSNALGGVKLWVREKDAADAANLLDQQRPEAFEVEGVGEYKQPHCPNCGSMDVTFEGLNKRAAYATLIGTWLLGFVPAIPFKHADWKCHACGQRWKETDQPDNEA
ncbi:MAG TPA: hypothetical protein VHX36_07255 [Candidatus Acidoferrales bacterium]|nr:hypothetical protein [Candidatus Acidoferrales bacterium]